MFISTMNHEEIIREARKDFFELSGKLRMYLERFAGSHARLLNNSRLQLNDQTISLITRRTEHKQWKTRQHNLWHSIIYVNHKVVEEQEIGFQYYLYCAVPRENGTEYIMFYDLQHFIVLRFTLHFIERYKERHLAAHDIQTGSIPAVVHFLMKNELNAFPGVYYKTSDIGEEETASKQFWICDEGIYVTDSMKGMRTFLTFLDKSDLSGLKQKVYEEELVWHRMKIITNAQNENVKDNARITRACYELYHTPNVDKILTRFAKRNIDLSKQHMVELTQEVYQSFKKMMNDAQNALAERDRQEQELMRKYHISSVAGVDKIPTVDIKEYDLKR